MSAISDKSSAISLLPKNTPVWCVSQSSHKLCTAYVHTVELEPDALAKGFIKPVYTLVWSGLLWHGPTAFFTCDGALVFERTEEGTKAALEYMKQAMQREHAEVKGELEQKQRELAGLEHYLEAPECYCFEGLTASEYNNMLRKIWGTTRRKCTQKGDK